MHLFRLTIYCFIPKLFVVGWRRPKLSKNWVQFSRFWALKFSGGDAPNLWPNLSNYTPFLTCAKVALSVKATILTCGNFDRSTVNGSGVVKWGRGHGSNSIEGKWYQVHNQPKRQAISLATLAWLSSSSGSKLTKIPRNFPKYFLSLYLSSS